MKTFPWVVLFCCLLCETQAISYPFSSKDFERECRDMFPEALNKDAQLSAPPYEFRVSDSIYEGVQYVEVVLRAKGEYQINGFLIQARLSDCSSKEKEIPVGSFVPEPNYENDVEVLNCAGKDSSAVMSKRWKLDRDHVKIRWYKPKNEKRQLHFRATVIANKNLFWMDNFSEHIRSGAQLVTKPSQYCIARLTRHDGKDTPNKAATLPCTIALISTLMFYLI